MMLLTVGGECAVMEGERSKSALPASEPGAQKRTGGKGDSKGGGRGSRR
jgi:hypothetical protein